MTTRNSDSMYRRRFLSYVAGSPLFLPLAAATTATGLFARTEQNLSETLIRSSEEALNLFDFIPVAQREITSSHWAYLMSGCDDNLTVQANRDGFQLYQIRPRRFVDTERIDTSIEVFGRRYPSPVMLAPVGSQRAFHGEGELAVARAARSCGTQMILSTLTTSRIEDVARECGSPPWFQLYPTNEWEVTRKIIERAEQAGCQVLVLTADNPARSNREMAKRYADKTQTDCQACHEPGGFFGRRPMFEGIDLSRVRSHLHPITWDLVAQIRQATHLKIVIKGVVTAEDAELCIGHDIDGIIVSNHGGRQEESLLSTIEALPEIVEAVQGKIPILIDSGFRRGTDIFKALALGAQAICIGRPYIWGLGAFGQPGVERVLELLRAELSITMKMAGTTTLSGITPKLVRRRP